MDIEELKNKILAIQQYLQEVKELHGEDKEISNNSFNAILIVLDSQIKEIQDLLD